MSPKKRLLSGIQPTGNFTLGNYLGAIKNWLQLQDDYECFFSLVDLHALTIRQDPKSFRAVCLDVIALYIACGIDPKKNTIFIQSHVPEHSELAWILNCYTLLNELKRMNQFKDKSKQNTDNINVALFDYPVLMAADILLYNSDLVPVGEDQTQHLELTRSIARRFNDIYGCVFKEPKAYIPPLGKRIMSLQEPKQKMSKSDSNPNNMICLLDPPEKIVKKIKKSVTDMDGSIRFDPKNKPGVSNLLTIFSLVSNQSLTSLETFYSGKGYGVFKKDLAEALKEYILPIQKHFVEVRSQETYLQEILKKGAKTAQKEAHNNLKRVKEALGMLMPIF